MDSGYLRWVHDPDNIMELSNTFVFGVLSFKVCLSLVPLNFKWTPFTVPMPDTDMFMVLSNTVVFGP